jgi:AraC family transcriptional activator of pobA
MVKYRLNGLQVIDCKQYNSVAACSLVFHEDWIVLLLLLSGSVDVVVAKNSLKIRDKEVILLLPPINIDALNESVVISAVCFTTEFAVFGKIIETEKGYLGHLFGNPNKQIQLTNGQSARLSERIHSLEKVAAKKKAIPFQQEIVLLLFNLVLYEYLSLVRSQGVLSGEPSRKEKLFLDFIELVVVHFRKEHSVKFYADSLCITTGYLGRAIREMGGRSAKHFIEMAIVSEAYTLLGDQGLSIADIAEELAFSGTSTFSTFFKKAAMISPRAYRESILQSKI